MKKITQRALIGAAALAFAGTAAAAVPQICRSYSMTARHSGKCLDVAGASMDSGAGLIQFDCHGGGNQKFRLAEASDRRYVQIIAQHSNMCMDVAGASRENSVQLIQYPCHGGDNQQFRLDRRGDYYQVVAKHSGKCLDIAGASGDNGAQLIQFDCHGGDNQRFRF